MSKKHVSKILILALVLTLSLSVCSCSVIRDVSRVPEFTEKLMSVSSVGSSEEALAKIEELVHPSSPLNEKSIIDIAKEDDALQGLDLEQLAKESYSIGKISDLELKFNDKELGGNVYETYVDVTFGSYKFIVSVRILSDDNDIGIYDFDISR